MAAVEATLHTQLSIEEAAEVFQFVANEARGLKAKYVEWVARG